MVPENVTIAMNTRELYVECLGNEVLYLKPRMQLQWLVQQFLEDVKPMLSLGYCWEIQILLK